MRCAFERLQAALNTTGLESEEVPAEALANGAAMTSSAQMTALATPHQHIAGSGALSSLAIEWDAESGEGIIVIEDDAEAMCDEEAEENEQTERVGNVQWNDWGGEMFADCREEVPWPRAAMRSHAPLLTELDYFLEFLPLEYFQSMIEHTNKAQPTMDLQPRLYFILNFWKGACGHPICQSQSFHASTARREA
eukprot:m.1597 g.1597  ORF g.1597 m.1597 type:complete len:194 (-) comp1003_c0_seq1:1045-1626(-)